MKKTIVTSITCVFLLCTALAATSAFSQTSTAGRQAAAGVTQEKVDLSESSRASAEVAKFLAQPKLAEAIAAAKANKEKGEESRRSANEYLAKSGIQVPSDMKVVFEPSGGGAASKVKVSAKITCCPLTIEIIISF
jgi:hypothetical protein